MKVPEGMLNESIWNSPFAVCGFCGELIYATDDYITGTAGGKIAYVHSVCLDRKLREQAENASRQMGKYEVKNNGQPHERNSRNARCRRV